MDSFQITVLVVVAALLILIFATIGILTMYAESNKVYPPMANTCPDYWTVNDDGTCAIPDINSTNPNRGNLGSSSISDDRTQTGSYVPGYSSSDGKIDFSHSDWAALGKTAICAKKSWVNTNDISWDGVSNYNSCD